jgi:excisionase family DNA binding protein
LSELELLTTAQVLKLLQIGRTKLWELVRAGAFPAYRIGSSSLRYQRAEVMRWLERRRVGSGGGAARGREGALR